MTDALKPIDHADQLRENPLQGKMVALRRFLEPVGKLRTF
jgi:hypothetical protein